MLSEIQIAEKLSLIKEKDIKDNIINSGRIQGINIYKENINILIAKKSIESTDDILIVKKGNFEIISKSKKSFNRHKRR